MKYTYGFVVLCFVRGCMTSFWSIHILQGIGTIHWNQTTAKHNSNNNNNNNKTPQIQRADNVMMLWCRFDVKMTLLLRHVAITVKVDAIEVTTFNGDTGNMITQRDDFSVYYTLHIFCPHQFIISTKYVAKQIKTFSINMSKEIYFIMNI